MDSRERYDDPEVMLRAMLAGLQSSLWTALPGAIVSFDSDAVTATVQPGVAGQIKTQDGSVMTVNLPVLTDVPVVFPRGGGCTLTFPVAAGDECLIVFASRSIDAWSQSGGVQKPADARRHDLSDAFVILGPQSQANKISGISTTKTQLRSNDGSTFVELDPAGQIVNVTAPGGMTITTPAIHITGDMEVGGNSTLKGNADVQGDTTVKGITSNGHDISSTHKHTLVQPGTGIGGPPQ